MPTLGSGGVWGIEKKKKKNKEREFIKATLIFFTP